MTSGRCPGIVGQECSDRLVCNACDNTIACTTVVLSRLIDKLKDHADEFDSFLFSASDHGESPGGNGVYLHGLPYYALAPKAQTDVPFSPWLADGFRQRHSTDALTVERFGKQRLSHDKIAHSLTSISGIEASSHAAHSIILRIPDRAAIRRQ